MSIFGLHTKFMKKQLEKPQEKKKMQEMRFIVLFFHITTGSETRSRSSDKKAENIIIQFFWKLCNNLLCDNL